jgi:hypothetical protein
VALALISPLLQTNQDKWCPHNHTLSYWTLFVSHNSGVFASCNPEQM